MKLKKQNNKTNILFIKMLYLYYKVLQDIIGVKKGILHLYKTDAKGTII